MGRPKGSRNKPKDDLAAKKADKKEQEKANKAMDDLVARAKAKGALISDEIINKDGE